MAASPPSSLRFTSTAVASASATSASAAAALSGYVPLARRRAPSCHLCGASSLMVRPFYPFSLLFHPHPPSTGIPSKLIRRSTLPVSASAGPQPPSPEPPFRKGSDGTSGLQATLHSMQDGIRIFFAVLFWISLFFWASAWDGRDDNDRTNKTSRRFKR